MTDFYDSSRWGLIPAGARALLYGDGRFAVTQAQSRRFTAVRWITVFGSADCGAADFENGNSVFEGAALRNWAEARKAMGCRARVYTDFANLATAHGRVGDMPNVVYWLATLDGVVANVTELAETAREHGVTLTPEQIWAVQYKGGPTAPYDESLLLGIW
jgi:hypothetical protein